MGRNRIIENTQTYGDNNEKICARPFNSLSVKDKKEIYDLYKVASSQMTPKLFDTIEIGKKYNVNPLDIEKFIEEKSKEVYKIEGSLETENDDKNIEDGEEVITAHLVVGPKPMSVEDMIKIYNINTAEYEIVSVKHNQWPTSMRREDGRVTQIMNHQTTVELKRRYPKFFNSIKDFLIKELKGERKIETLQEALQIRDRENYIPLNTNREISKVLAMTVHPDAHIDIAGKYSMNTRKKKILEAEMRALDLIDRIESFQKQLYVILGDFFTTNNVSGTPQTVGRVRQDVKVPLKEGRKKGVELETDLLYNKSLISKVDVIIKGGNHDLDKLFHLEEFLKERFKGNDRINFIEPDRDVEAFSFYPRGSNHFGFAHKRNDLKQLPTYTNSVGASNKMRYLGDKHKEEVININGNVINTLGAMKPKGGWYAENGIDRHNGNIFAALFHKNKGKLMEFYQPIYK